MDNLANEKKDDESVDTFTYDVAVELAGHGRYNYRLLIACCLITNACAVDMYGFGVVVAAASCDLNLDLTQTGILASAPFAGVVFAFPWGYYADTKGRKRAMMLSTSVGFVFAVISAFSTNWLFMLIIKMIGCNQSVRGMKFLLNSTVRTGMNFLPAVANIVILFVCIISSSTASFSLTMTLLGECTGSKRRNQYLFIMHSCNLAAEIVTFCLAWLFLPLNFKVPLSLLHTTFRPWRLFTIILALPLGMGACFMFYLYESPKYLASNGQCEKALEVLRNIYERNGGKRENYAVKQIIQDSNTQTDGQSFCETLKKQSLPIFKPPLLWRTIQLFFLVIVCMTTNNTFFMWYPTMVNLFFNSFGTEESSTQTFCQRMFGETNSTYETHTCNDGISLNTIYSGTLYGLFYLLASLAVIKVASRPRLLLTVVLLISGVSLLLVNLKNPIANIVFFTLLQATSLGMGCNSTYFVNLYPTIHRGQVTSLGLMVGRLSVLVCVSVMGSFITQYCEVTFYAWSVFVFAGVVVCQFLPPDRKKLETLT